MLSLLSAGVFAVTSLPSPPSEYTKRHEVIDRFCAYVVGIPYASDSFSDDEWNRFLFCRKVLRYYE